MSDETMENIMKIEQFVQDKYKTEVNEESPLSVFVFNELDLLDFIDGIEQLFDIAIDDSKITLETTVQQLAEMF